MSASRRPERGAAVVVHIDTPERLRHVMGADFALSDQQFAAVTAPLEPAVVVAGAGSGKTSVMAARVVWLVATGRVTPEQVLGLTFTTKATHELGSRIRDALRAAGTLRPVGWRAGEDEPEAEEPTVSTYNAYAASLLTEHGLRIGHEPDTRVIADASRYQLAARAVARYTGRVEHLTDHPETAIKNLLGLDAALSEHLRSPHDVREFHAGERPAFEAEHAAATTAGGREAIHKVLDAMTRREELLGLVEAYRRLKSDLGLMDFSDQIELGARLAVEQPEVGRAEREKFRVVLLDEYQDTSVAQALMLSRLFSGPSAAEGRGHPVTAVGDPNQAIYGWRGASVSNIVHFADDFPTESGERPSYPLTVNRRSDARILGTANHVAAPLYAALPDVRPLDPKPGAVAGTVRVAVHHTYDAELAWLPGQVAAAHAAMTLPRWSEIGVLTRDNAHAADVFDALTAQEIPVEIVGLQGLLRLPEVAEVVATLHLLHDLTANASMLTLLTGPRWLVGPRDLALLGARARSLARDNAPLRDRPDQGIDEELTSAVRGADPTEVVSLSDALDDPGDAPYSAEARARFALLAAELKRLRRAAGEPLLDLVRRIVDATGIDVELASSVSPAASARRDNLDLFVKAVAEFQAIDGAVTLPALLAYLEAEDEYGAGLDVATPTKADSVKLLTMHRAKGLEWASVFVVGVADTKFPSAQSRTKWTSGPGVLPIPLRGDERDLPALRGHDHAALKAFTDDSRSHESTEELRLAYVAFTRAKEQLVVSSYCWSTRKTPLGPSVFQEAIREAMQEWGGEPELWEDRPARSDPNPVAAEDRSQPWPIQHHTEEVTRRMRAAGLVRGVLESGSLHRPDLDDRLDLVDRSRVEEWDAEMSRLLDEAARDRASHVPVPLPSSLSATSLARLRDDPDRFAAELARPMPRRPSSSARFGTRFHAWVEARFGQQNLIDPDELPGRADAEIDDDSDLQQLVKQFSEGPFADRRPAAVEPPFALVLAGQVVRGRIDAVYREEVDGHEGYLLVDWKTSRAQTADPLQLAIYRVAWAELVGVPVEHVRAAFYYVRTGDLVEPTGLDGRAALERLIAGPDGSPR